MGKEDDNQIQTEIVLTRRNFLYLLGLAGWVSATIDLGVVAAVIKKYENDLLTERAPQVEKLLLETLRFARSEYLALFNASDQKDFIKMVLNRQRQLMSPSIFNYERDRARWDVTRYTFDRFYQFTWPHYEDRNQIIHGGHYLEFLEMSAGQLDPTVIASHSPEEQANMWVEACFRAHAADWWCDPRGSPIQVPDGPTILSGKTSVGGYLYVPSYHTLP